MEEKDVILKTQRLTLRPLNSGDLETAHEYAGDMETTRYMVFPPHSTVEETGQFLREAAAEWAKEKPDSYEFAVLLEGRHIGAVSVYLDESGQEGELGWIINKAYQGKGYATEAARAAMEFAVRELRVKKVVAHCDCRNEASRRVMDKIGLSLESADGMRCNKGCEVEVPEFLYSRTVAAL